MRAIESLIRFLPSEAVTPARRDSKWFAGTYPRLHTVSIQLRAIYEQLDEFDLSNDGSVAAGRTNSLP
jgi:hypothetical protein